MQAYDKAGSRFNRAKEKIKVIRAQLNENDRILIVPAQQPEQILNDSLQLASLAVSYGAVDWRNCLKIANNYFQMNPNYNKDLFIVSDFQFHESLFKSALAELKEVKIYLINIHDHSINNVSIDSLMIRNKIFEIGKTMNLDVIVRNSSPDRIDNTELHLFIDQQRMAYQKFSLQALERRIITLSCQIKSSPKLEGYVELSDDDLNGDNRYYFALTLPDSIRVLVVDESRSLYLETAFKSIERNTSIRVTREKYSSWAGKRFEHFQVLFLSDFAGIPAVLLNRLNAFLSQGGSLILMPGERIEIPEFKSLCNQLNLDIFPSELKEVSPDGDFYSLKSGDWQQPVFSDIFRNEYTDLSNPGFSKYFKISPGSSTDVLISFNTGDPFVLNVTRDRRSIFIICSYIDDHWTDFQFKGTFLPLLLRLLLMGATNVDQLNQTLTIGQSAPLRFILPEDFRELFLKSTEGDITKIITPLSSTGIILDPRSIRVPGNYKLYSDAHELSTLSVNACTRALVPPFINTQQLIDSLDTAYLIPEDSDLVKIINENRTGIELFNALILLVFLTIFLEIVLIKSIEGTKIF
jgi:hypothetical protein